jgi:nucleoside 2-deoxyribosyltransferase
LKPSEIIEAIERLFLDITAYVIPGASLILGMALLFFSVRALSSSANYVEQNGYLIWFFLFGAYVVGQALETFGNLGTEKVAVLLSSAFFSRIPQGLRRRCTPAFIGRNELERTITRSELFAGAVQKLQTKDPTTLSIKKDDLHSWRNIALSEGSAEQKHLVYRFMFMSILSLGMATVCFVLATGLLVMATLHALGVRSLFLDLGQGHWFLIAILVGFGYVFLRRRAEFHARSMRVPFSMVKSSRDIKDFGTAAIAPSQRQMMKVYLAGGFHSGWQDDVKLKLSDFCFFDPRAHHLVDTQQYTEWDLGAIRQSDWIFAYLEKQNPGGYALALELGFARALSKKILLVDEKSAEDRSAERRLAMLHVCADVSVASLEEAVIFFRQLSQVH